MLTVWPLLLPVAAGSGWWIARSSQAKKKKKMRADQLSQEYLRGLNFLLNEEPDKAVDLFIKMLEVDGDTIETHLALGNLFRRRGEVHRAIRIHQNVVARPNLKKSLRADALFALARDYLASGVLDRAEKLFLELIDLHSHIAVSLQYLIDIYQQEKDWARAIDVVRQLAAETGKGFYKELAHYHCELAELALEQSDIDEAHRYLKRALSIDKKCARASLLLGGLEYVSGRHKHAIRLYKQIRNQDAAYLSEAIVPLAEVYQALNEEEALEVYLRKMMQDFPGMPIVLLLSEKIRNWRGDKVATQFVTDYVNKNPSVAGLHRLIDLRLSTDESPREDLYQFRQLTEKILAQQSSYLRDSCGFTSKSIHWLCPSCKRWGTVKPACLVEKESFSNAFAVTWTQQDEDDFRQKTKQFDEIDKKLWAPK